MLLSLGEATINEVVYYKDPTGTECQFAKSHLYSGTVSSFVFLVICTRIVLIPSNMRTQPAAFYKYKQ